MFRALHADHVILGDQDPIADAAVVLAPDGTVQEVGPAGEVLPRHAGVPCDRVRGVLFPGLVNAHGHLELSVLRGQIPGGAGFVPWAEKLIDTRSEILPEDQAAAIERAVADLVAFGTAAIGEVTNSLAAVESLVRAKIAGSIFHEIFGLSRAAVMDRATELGERAAGWQTVDLRYAPAPHTLYTTHPDAVRVLVDHARARGLVTSLHLSEHPSERSALEDGAGPIPAWLSARLNLLREDLVWPRLSPIAFADALGALGPHVVAVHLTDARPVELDLVALRGSPVVLCPRSNLHIEGKYPPLLAMRKAGIEAALGTDSLASNASLDVLAEARALSDRFSSVPPRELLRMATWNGARALQRTDLGRIARGARPGILAVEGDVGVDPSAFLLRNLRAPRRWVARREADAVAAARFPNPEMQAQ